jgi:hypothetical protein
MTNPATPADAGNTPDGETQTGQPVTGVPSDPKDARIAELSNEAKAWRKQLRDAQAELESLKAAGQSEAEKAIAAARLEGAAEYQKKWRSANLTNAALTVLTEKGVTATDLAIRALDLDDIEMGDDGKPDRAAIEAKVTDLISRYPVLTPQSGPPLGSATGEAQRRVTNDQILKPGMSDKQTEEALRWALRG